MRPSESELLSLLDHTSEYVYVIDLDTYELLYANDATKTWKHDPDLVGHPCYKAMNKRDERCPFCFVPKMERGHASFDEAYVSDLDKWLKIDALETTWGGHRAAAVFSTDITEFKKREAKDQQRFEQSINTLSDAYPRALATFRLNLTKDWVGDGASPLDFVLKQQESGTVEGYFKAFSELIADENIKAWFFDTFDREKLIKGFDQGKTEISFEYPIVYEDGIRHWRQGLLYMMQNPTTGDIEGRTYALDIDARKRNESILDVMTANEIDYIALIHPSTLTLEFLTMQGSIAGARIGEQNDYNKCRDIVLNSQIAEQDAKRYREFTELDNLVDRLNLEGDFALSFAYENGDEHRKQLRYRWLGKPGEDILLTRVDVTQAYQQEQERIQRLKEAVKEAERANSAEQAFLASMSHDMRTPLSGIIGFTELAMGAPEIDKKQQYLEKIDSSGHLMLDLVNDILDLSKIESGKMDLHPEAFEAKGLVEGIVDSVKLSAEQRDITLTTDFDPAYPRFILADRLRLQQIILNLLSNAIKYTPDGGTVHFETQVIEESGYNTLARISDNGIGMSKEFQQRMFDPFSQEHQSRMYGTQGTGLGLSIVKRIVNILGGKIVVDSELGKGSTFSVYLPLEVVEAGQSVKSEHKEADTSIAGRRILLCEDNELNAEIAETILRERGGADVESVINGQLGLEAFEASAPGYFDAILMDVRMPIMDGLEATRSIRKLNRPDAKTIPIIAMTADAFAEDVENCLKAGMNGHVAKPINPAKLINDLFEAISAQ